jgi:hypothetical protein
MCYDTICERENRSITRDMQVVIIFNINIKFKAFLRKPKCDSTFLSDFYLYLPIFVVDFMSIYSFRRGFCCTQSMQYVGRRCLYTDPKTDFTKSYHQIMLISKQTLFEICYWDPAQYKGIAGQIPVELHMCWRDP